MTGDEFIEIAGKIAATGRNAASIRTAISRAYYGAFHLAKAFLDVIGVQPPKNANTHAFVRMRFMNCGQENGELVGLLLRDLYADRLAADYDLLNKKVESIGCARTRVEIASQIQSALSACRDATIRDKIKAGVENYERKISDFR